MRSFILLGIISLAVCTVSAQVAVTPAVAQTAVLPEDHVRTLFEQARLAFEREQYTEALQHLAQGSLAHSRDAEWTPAAVFLEGTIYKKTGQAEAAAYAAEELALGWPESIWSRRAAELNESTTEQGESR
jgi:hypothetical protein